MALRTLQIAHRRGATLNAAVVLYTCPADHTLLLKDLRLSNAGAAALDCAVAVRKAGVTTAIFRQAVAPTSVVGDQRATVLEPGDELTWTVSGAAGTDVTVAGVVASGALLAGTVE